MSVKYSDDKIIAMVKESSFKRELAIEILYKCVALRNMAFSKINSMIHDESTASDIFIESLLAFIKNIRYNKFKGESKISTYIVGICNFKCLSYLNKQKNEQNKSQQYLADLDPSSLNEDNIETQIVDIEESRYDAKLKRKVWRLLSQKCRDTLRKKYGKNLSVKDIANLNNIAEQSVKNALSRCYHKLREIIQQDPEVMEAIKRNYGRI